MAELMVRVEAESFDAWLATHYDHVADRKAHGMADGPVYRDIDDPNAALFHIHVEDMERAMEWFRSETFRRATKRATVTRRELYTAELKPPGPASA